MYVTRDQVPAATVENERRIAEATAKEEAELAARSGDWKRGMEFRGSFEDQIKMADKERTKDEKHKKEIEKRKAKRRAEALK
jgi:elongation factor Ts